MREVSANNSEYGRQALNRKYKEKNSKKKIKKLDEIEEVYEELSGFLAHTKMAFLSFFSLIFYSLKISIGFLFFRIIFPVLEKIMWVIFLIMVFICTIFAFIGNLVGKLRNKKKRLNPFLDQNKMQRIQKFDKIFEIKKFTLILDLDGTLVHATRTKRSKLEKGIQYEKLNMNILGHGRQAVHLYSRPHLDDFLSKLSEHFNLAVFSASEACYCDVIIDHIDKWRAIQQRFYKQHVDINHRIVSKDLTKIIKGSLDNVIMIEDAPGACMQRENTIIINKWNADNGKDNELKFLMDVLLEHVGHAQNSASLINYYRQKLGESTRNDVILDFPEEHNDSIMIETDGGMTSPNYESTVRDDTEISHDDISRLEISAFQDPPATFVKSHSLIPK